MGNKRARNLTRPKERGKPCTCDVFHLTVACENDELVVSLLTDLPVNTRVTRAGHSLWSESDGHRWHWTCIEDAVPVTPQQNDLNGFVLRLTNDELDNKGLHMYRHLSRSMKVSIANIPSSMLEISVSAPTTNHRFGICNRRLTGKAVVVRPDGQSLEQSAKIDVPPSEAVMKKIRF